MKGSRLRSTAGAGSTTGEGLDRGGPRWTASHLGEDNPSGGGGGPAARALLNELRDTAAGPDGSIYVADTFNHRIRRITPDGDISTVAGDGTTTYDGDDQAATDASLYWPHDVAVDADGVLYIADSNHHRVRRVDTAGVITTVAGRGAIGSTGDGGPAVLARIKNPKSVAP
jgi:NHL repeat